MSGSVFSPQKLGEHQSMTPDGFLLCTAVPIARTGVLLYADGEVPVEPDGEGVIRVSRDEDEVFAPIAIASFAGKPVTNDHPPEKVAPENWKTYSVGVVLNPRRGDGLRYDNQFLYADLLIQDQLAILDVREGKREVSAGYDAEYEQLEPGQGRQHLIIGNHVALVERGRCGPRCSIGDNAMPAGKKQRPAWFDRIMAAHATRDSEVLVDELEKVGEMLGDVLSGDSKTTDRRTSDDLGGGGVHVHLHQPEGPVKDDDPTDPTSEAGATPSPAAAAAAGGGDPMAQLMARIEALEKAVAILAQEGNGDANGSSPAEAESTPDPDKDDDDNGGNGFDKKTVDRRGTKDRRTGTRDGVRAAVGDSTSLRSAWSDLVARAEILAPGIRMPTFDAQSPAKTTFDAMCNFRRRVLKEALVEDDTRQAIESLSGGKPNLTMMTCDSVQVLFNGASELVRQQSTRGSITEGRNYNPSSNNSLTDTVRLINQRNRERYGFKA